MERALAKAVRILEELAAWLNRLFSGVWELSRSWADPGELMPPPSGRSERLPPGAYRIVWRM